MTPFAHDPVSNDDAPQNVFDRADDSGPDVAASGAVRAADRVEAVVDAGKLGQVRRLVEPLVAAHGLSFVDLEWTQGDGGRILRLIIERVEPSVSADQTPESGSLAESSLAAHSSEAADRLMAGGITLADCVGVSKDVSRALDVEEVIRGRYQLEVTSPGLDRPLRIARDFERQLGRLIKAKLASASHDGQMVLRGTIDAVVAAEDSTGGTIEMTVDGNRHMVEISNIETAKVVFDLAGGKRRAAKPRKASRRSK